MRFEKTKSSDGPPGIPLFKLANGSGGTFRNEVDAEIEKGETGQVPIPLRHDHFRQARMRADAVLIALVLMVGVVGFTIGWFARGGA